MSGEKKSMTGAHNSFFSWLCLQEVKTKKKHIVHSDIKIVRLKILE